MIFDLGFYNGLDAEFYIKKGHKVVGLEANPDMVKKGIIKFKKHIEKGRLILINKAVFDKIGTITFYVNDIYSSYEKWIAERDGTRSKPITVKTTTLTELCKEYGTPHYIKVDIEGCEAMISKQVFTLKKKPQFISFETLWKTFAEVFAWLLVSGYKKFQLINQLNNPKRNPLFTEYSSGYFGEDLPKNKWISYEELLERYMKYRDLRIIDKEELSLGWLDVHARL